MTRNATRRDQFPTIILIQVSIKNETNAINQRSYWIGIALCDFCLFTKIKFPLREKYFDSNEAIKQKSQKGLKVMRQCSYLKSREDWVLGWNSCIQLDELYFGDIKINFYEIIFFCFLFKNFMYFLHRMYAQHNRI